jgi:alpha-L-arabinofuranosidase
MTFLSCFVTRRHHCLACLVAYLIAASVDVAPADEPARITIDVQSAGRPAWGDYTLTLKARKRSGDEGFLILFHTANTEAPTWWNIGGWRNTAHAFQNGGFSETQVPCNIETDRWYDICIELAGGTVKGYLDGKLVQSAELKSASSLFAAAGRDEKTLELVLELANPGPEPRSVNIDLQNFGSRQATGKMTTLGAEDPNVENTLDGPSTISPRESELPGIQSNFVAALPANSVQILRIPLQGH